MTITIREPGSAITHLIGLLLAAFAAIPMLVKAALFSTRTAVAAMAVFMTSMILLYAASTLYHSVNLTGSKLKLFKKLDHMMIFVLIAGTYTPVCMVVLGDHTGCRISASHRCMGYRSSRYALQALLGDLSEIYFFYYICRDGMGLPLRIWSAHSHPEPRSLFLAAGRRTLLHRRRHHLCTAAPVF